MLADDKMLDLLKKLSNEFNVLVRTFGPALDERRNEYVLIGIDDQTDPAVVAQLPATFANEKIGYKLTAPAFAQKVAAPGCGQVGHVCGCGTNIPKPE